MNIQKWRRRSASLIFFLAPAVGTLWMFPCSGKSAPILATYELQAIAGSGYTVSGGGTSVTLTSPSAAVQVDIYEQITNLNSNQTDDGILNSAGGLVATSSGLNGGFSVPTVASNFQGASNQTGALVPVGGNTNIGNETTFGSQMSSANSGNDFAAVSLTAPAGYQTGSNATSSSPVLLLLGTSTFTLTAASQSATTGSVALQYVPDYNNGASTFSRDQKFESDGTTYSVDGSGTGVNGSSSAVSGKIGEGTQVTIFAAPEPGSLGLATLGIAGLLLRRRKPVF